MALEGTKVSSPLSIRSHLDWWHYQDQCEFKSGYIQKCKELSHKCMCISQYFSIFIYIYSWLYRLYNHSRSWNLNWETTAATFDHRSLSQASGTQQSENRSMTTVSWNVEDVGKNAGWCCEWSCKLLSWLKLESQNCKLKTLSPYHLQYICGSGQSLPCWTPKELAFLDGYQFMHQSGLSTIHNWCIWYYNVLWLFVNLECGIRLWWPFDLAVDRVAILWTKVCDILRLA